MNKREMALFEAVARTGSVTKGAAAIGMAQPAASAMLKGLDSKLGFALFSRDRRRLEMTAEARTLLPEVVNALAAFDTAERMAASMRRGTHGQLVVGAVASLGASLLPGAIAYLKERDPSLHVAVRTDMTLAIAGMAADQRIDVGFIVGSPTLPNAGQLLLATLGLQAVMTKDHAYVNKQAIALADLRDQPYISLSRHLQIGALTARQFEAAQLPFTPQIEVNQCSAACAFAERGLGIAILDDMSALYASRHGLVVRPILGDGALPLCMVWPLNKGLGRAARQLEAGLRKEMSAASLRIAP